MQAGILILGAGVVGASVAYHLARRGCDVLVADRAPTFGLGSTGKATGGFRAQTQIAKPLAAAMRRGSSIAI